MCCDNEYFLKLYDQIEFFLKSGDKIKFFQQNFLDLNNYYILYLFRILNNFKKKVILYFYLKIILNNLGYVFI